MMGAFGLITKNLDNILKIYLFVNIMKITLFQILIKAWVSKTMSNIKSLNLIFQNQVNIQLEYHKKIKDAVKKTMDMIIKEQEE